MNFEDTKKEILRRAKEKGACAVGYKAGLEASTPYELLEVIMSNFWWSYDNGVIDAKFLEDNFENEDLENHHIYTRGDHIVRGGRAYAVGTAMVKAYEHACVIAYERASVEGHDRASILAYGDVDVLAYDNAILIAYDNVTVNAYGSSHVCSSSTKKVYYHDKIDGKR